MGYFDSLLSKSDDLIRHMIEYGYSDRHVRSVRSELDWIRDRGDAYESYREACVARESETDSAIKRRGYRAAFNILMRFDLDGEYPERGNRGPLFDRGSYPRLEPEFREVIDRYEQGAAARGVSEGTMRTYRYATSAFLLSMQEAGRRTLGEITEDDVLAHFTDESGAPAYSGSFTNPVARVLSSDLGDLSGDARRIASYVPRVRDGHKNVQFLRKEEAESLRAALDGECGALGLRERAMGSVLFYTGLRACDVAALRLDDIDWERDEISLTQKKTGQPLTLPLTAPVGNALYDYIADGRPDVDDPHVFLSLTEPYRGISAGAVHNATDRIYDAAGIRLGKGDRRGTHLLRHNVATTMVSSGTPKAVAGAVLGHRDPKSTDRYLSADLEHLRSCSLDVSRFPVGEGVFDI